jgi:hypothetical protein
MSGITVGSCANDSDTDQQRHGRQESSLWAEGSACDAVRAGGVYGGEQTRALSAATAHGKSERVRLRVVAVRRSPGCDGGAGAFPQRTH